MEENELEDVKYTEGQSVPSCREEIRSHKLGCEVTGIKTVTCLMNP